MTGTDADQAVRDLDGDFVSRTASVNGAVLH